MKLLPTEIVASWFAVSRKGAKENCKKGNSSNLNGNYIDIDCENCMKNCDHSFYVYR